MMSMKLPLILAAAFAAASGPAYAQALNSDNGDVAISGQVASLCILGAPSESAIDLGQMIATSGTRVGKIAPLGSQQVTLLGSFCNFAGTSLKVSAQALVANDSATLESGFARAVNYKAEVSNWAATSASATTEATAGGATPLKEALGGTQATPKLADLTLSLSNFTVPSDLLLIAGGYNGVVTITLGPSN
jgi:type 1 fimbria pilin